MVFNSTFLAQAQSLPLEAKIVRAQTRIRAWYEHFDGDVYVSFSGGKDSTVLLHLVRSLYPWVAGVFCNTGLEYPEIVDFVRSTDNIEWLTPALNFRKVLEQYGYPVVSKEQSDYINDYRTGSEKLQHLRWHGRPRKDSGRRDYKISEKWKYLVDAPFKISEKCCDVMKKRPFERYERSTGVKAAILGTMAQDSNQRKGQLIRHGCNAFTLKRPHSTPMGVWTDEDVWEYIARFDVPYSPIYDMGYTRTGCMFCLFGLHLDGKPNRFDRMKKTHPKQYRYCMEQLGLREVIDWLENSPR